MTNHERLGAGKHSSQFDSKIYYKLEARTDAGSPRSISHGLILDDKWREVPIKICEIGVPIRKWDRLAGDHGLATLPVIEALRYHFIASLEARGRGGALCVETRLVQVKTEYTFTTEEIGVTPAQSALREGPLNIQPRFSPSNPAGAGK